jgi:pimeloyl-ACP methyl ester carboxylesterase
VLSDRFRVVAYSRRHHWPNQTIAEGADYAMQEHVDDLASVLHALDLGPANLVGHSYGAFVCLLLAIQRPDLVRSLVLAEPPVLTLFVSNRPTPTELLRVLVTRPRTALAILRFGALGIGPATAAVEAGHRDEALEIFGKAVLGTEAFQSLSPERLERVRANFIAAEFLGSGFAPLHAADVRAVEAPVLLVTGQHSPRLFHRFVDRLQELLPNAERVEIPAASHIVQEDNPAACSDAVLSFLLSETCAVRAR